MYPDIQLSGYHISTLNWIWLNPLFSLFSEFEKQKTDWIMIVLPAPWICSYKKYIKNNFQEGAKVDKDLAIATKN